MPYAIIDDVADWMGIRDGKLDYIIDRAIDAAQDWVDDYCNRGRGAFEPDTEPSDRFFDVLRDGTVLTDYIATATGLVVATDDSRDGSYPTTWGASDYQLLPLTPRGEPYTSIVPVGGRSFPMVTGSRRGLVRVTAQWGWPDAVPANIRQATVMKAAQIVNRRNSPNGVAGANDFGIVRISTTDAQIDDLLKGFVRVSLA